LAAGRRDPDEVPLTAFAHRVDQRVTRGSARALKVFHPLTREAGVDELAPQAVLKIVHLDHHFDTSAEAKEIGLIGYLVPDGSALEKALEVAEVINNNGPLAVRRS
jgi:hypothetical protein